MNDLPKLPILDQGYLALVETWGSDERIVEAARMSTGRGFLGWGMLCEFCGVSAHALFGACTELSGHCFSKPGDEKLLRYLHEHRHHTPFEMAGLVIEVQAPIFVFREWHRHRTQSYNEMSSRYVPLPDVNYIPTVSRLMMSANAANKQAGADIGAKVLTPERAQLFREAVAQVYDEAERLYQAALRDGVPKELARIHLPVGRYSRMRASANLRNWLAFLTLRTDTAAQWEIRQYALAVGSFIAERFPRTWELFAEGKK